METFERIARWFLIAVFLMGAGYTWRMIQVEPAITSEIEALRSRQTNISGNQEALHTRVNILEKKIKGVKK